MRTVFTVEDLTNIIEKVFNGNLKQHIFSNGEIEYENSNSEDIVLVDGYSGEQTAVDLAKYLNIKFYSWKERLISKDDQDFRSQSASLTVFDAWVQSLNFSLNEAYALVEQTDEEVVASQDIDSCTKKGKITFLIQTNKIKNLDYYITKIRNNYLGIPQQIQNSYGKTVNAYILLGTLLYDSEPFQTPVGECITVSCNFSVSYLNEALSYTDVTVELSLDEGVTYYTMPITKQTWQLVWTGTSVPTISRPDWTGTVNVTLSEVVTLGFYDYNKDLTNALNEIFWSKPAYMVDGTETTVQDVNIPVYLRITVSEHSYVYRMVLQKMEKVLTNSDFNVSSITVGTWGKVSS